MTDEEYGFLFHEAKVNLVAFKPIYLCSDELRKMVEMAIEKEREVVANWIMGKGFATGHGDSIVDLLDQLEWQIIEKEREACAKLVDYWEAREGEHADAIRARGQA